MAVLSARPQVDDPERIVERNVRGRSVTWRVLLYVLLIGGALMFAFPFYWLVSTSLKPETDVLLFPPDLIPSSFEWGNYGKVLSAFPFAQGLSNTLIILVAVEIGRLVSVPLVAYAFARLRFPGRNVLFVLVLGTMMLPYYVTLIPQYLIFRDLGWLNTFLPLTVPSFFGVGSAFFIFMMRQFYLSIPKEYDDAAMVDGCGRLRIFWHIILPQSKPALAALAIFTFTEQWNDYFGPLIYLTDQAKYTLALSLQAWQQTQQSGLGYKPHPFNEIMAVATLITLVPIVIFFFTQRYFLRGLIVSGIQG
ncbi:carbohydrate ABC transporter permease [Tenggerimyces flavus]|uniref:Carbohydrate ABC transporter permease n=1 Tax=Tenggerimyces flavus TaxID=1708749 RepID=A0ABV7YL58_9ACTN|nr:carbohydrate ABC transporter permease [Tenggerimyces flavus]MBM7789608.1 ABC-type glycerol-3-phosphate transport system permease component [Tenggerimyces flavus]